MVDVKAAVSSAIQYIQSIQEMMGDRLEDLRLEEVELSEGRDSWLITLGYDVPVKNSNRFEEMLDSQGSSQMLFKREYKLFKVNAETGEVESMKIRQWG